MRRSLILAVTLVLAGCPRRSPSREAPASSTAAETAASSTAAEPAAVDAPDAAARPPIRGPNFIELTLSDKSKAFAAVPEGARGPRPIVVGIHGAGDRPDWACSEWANTLAWYAFVVCPTGVPSQWAGFSSWGSAEQLAARADLAVAAIRASYGDDVAPGPPVFGGWSQGGTLAAAAIASRPGTYSHALLVEVGHTPLDANQVAASLRRGGVKGVVVSCSSMPCRTFAKQLERPAARSGLRMRTNDVGLRGHWFDEPVFRTLGPAFVWLVDGELAWAGLDSAVAARWGARDAGAP